MWPHSILRYVGNRPDLDDEPTTDAAREAWLALSRATSLVTHVEVRAALARAFREGRLDDTRLRAAKQQWDRLASKTDLIKVDNPVIASAGEVVEAYSLRTGDAVQLAAADNISENDPVFVAGDGNLLNAASAHGLATLNLNG